MKRKVKKRRSVFLKIFVLFVCGYFLISLTNLWSKYEADKKELEAQQQQLSLVENEVAELKAMLEDESNTPLIEKAARERLGYIYSDETVFIDISGN